MVISRMTVIVSDEDSDSDSDDDQADIIVK